MKASKLIILETGIFLVLILLFGCQSAPEYTIKQEDWGSNDSKKVVQYTLTNSKGMVVKIMNFGGTITAIQVPDKNGKIEDVVLGFDNLRQYQDQHPCFGATIGRFANRIRNGRFEIKGKVYQVEQNSGEHCLHGGNEFDRVVWDAERIETETGQGIRLHHISKDNTKGFPGNLDTYVTYLLTDDNAVEVHFEAETDKATHVNMTQHSYFNLSGSFTPIYDHTIKINADNYTEIDEAIIPTGVISTVKGKDWDLTSMTRIGKNINKLNNNGYHYNYIFNKAPHQFQKVIEVFEPNSGRTLEVLTTQPGVQFYSGNHISNELVGKGGKKYGEHLAFCLETQHFPDSPNHSNFPSTLLLPGKKYEETVVYKFGVKE